MRLSYEDWGREVFDSILITQPSALFCLMPECRESMHAASTW
jgi:hypothetical protein